MRDGWAEAMRLFRRLGANARYFTDQAHARSRSTSRRATRPPGMCIDYYGRFQAEAAAAAGRPGRVGFVTARGETSINADPIGLLRGAPHRELAIAFIEFVLSDDGQKLWSFRRGAPGGPERYALRRLPIVPASLRPRVRRFRADPDENALRGGARLRLPPAPGPGRCSARSPSSCGRCASIPSRSCRRPTTRWPAPGHPPEATALFDDVSAVDYATVAGPLRAALQSADPLDEARWSIRLVAGFRAQYRRVTALARAGR